MFKRGAVGTSPGFDCKSFCFRLSVAPLAGAAMIWLMRLCHSFYEELIVALLIGMLCGLDRGWRRMAIGGAVAAGSWVAGLALSGLIEARLGIAFGTWFTTAVALSCLPLFILLRMRKPIRAVGMLLLGIIIGLAVEILGLLPSFLHGFRFVDAQALTIFGAALLMIPLLGLGADRDMKAGRR